MAASATCTETRAWVSDPDNPSVFIISGTSGNLGGGGQRLTQKSKTGQVRTYGTGRVRTVVAADTQVQYTLVLVRLTNSAAEQLDTWRDNGTTLLFRDTYGQKVFGSILSTTAMYGKHSIINSAQPISDINGPFVDISVTITQVTVPEGS